jgi:hypothetical protein
MTEPDRFSIDIPADDLLMRAFEKTGGTAIHMDRMLDSLKAELKRRELDVQPGTTGLTMQEIGKLINSIEDAAWETARGNNSVNEKRYNELKQAFVYAGFAVPEYVYDEAKKANIVLPVLNVGVNDHPEESASPEEYYEEDFMPEEQEYTEPALTF